MDSEYGVGRRLWIHLILLSADFSNTLKKEDILIGYHE